MALRKLKSAGEIFDALGGVQAVADLMSTGYRAAFNWKAGGAFPPKTYVAMVEALRKCGCTAPASLWGMVTNEAAE